MANGSSSTLRLQRCLDRMHAGEDAAREELFRQAGGRLERLTRHMLKDFPRLRRWAQTDDVLQGALVRLLRALREVRPASTREFFRLTAAQIRRELLDLARHYYGPCGPGANHASAAGRGDSAPPLYDRPESADESRSLEAWCEFHQQVERLPAEEREVIDLLFYQGLSQAEAAAILNVTVRTVQRRWHSALVKLHDTLKGQWPGL